MEKVWIVNVCIIVQHFPKLVIQCLIEYICTYHRTRMTLSQAFAYTMV